MHFLILCLIISVVCGVPFGRVVWGVIKFWLLLAFGIPVAILALFAVCAVFGAIGSFFQPQPKVFAPNAPVIEVVQATPTPTPHEIESMGEKPTPTPAPKVRRAVRVIHGPNGEIIPLREVTFE